MNRLSAILIIGVLGFGNFANAADLLTMEGIAAYAFTHGKTTCTGGNDMVGNGGDGGGQFEVISNCDGSNGTHSFSVKGPAPSGGEATVVFEGAVFVDSQIGLLDGSGTGSPETFPYEGPVSSDSYVMFKAKTKKEITAWCLLTPYPDSGTTAVIDLDWAYSYGEWFSHCEDKSGAIIEGIWSYIPFGSVNGAGGRGRDKDRGCFWAGFLVFELSRGSSDTYEN